MRTFLCYLLLVLSTIIPSSVDAQKANKVLTKQDSTVTLEVDSTALLASPPRKNPKKALFLSLVVPGAGQIYNRSWWKVPIVYGGYAGLIYSTNFNKSRYDRFKTAYAQRLNNEEDEFKDKILSPRTLLSFRDRYFKRYQQSIIGLVAFHIVQSLDAYVDAHLHEFDVNEDLTITALKPRTDRGLDLIGFRYRLH